MYALGPFIVETSQNNLFTKLQHFKSVVVIAWSLCACYLSADPTFTLKNITSALKPVVEWKTLGVQLDISGTKIKEIDVNNRGQVAECKHDMVQFWLESDTSCSWKKLVDALNTCDQSVLAEKIKSTYCLLNEG